MGRLPKELPEAFALAEQGYSLSQIAKELQVAYWTVRYWAQRHGVKLPDRPKPPPKADAQQVIELAREGLHIAEIARQTGYTQGGVHQLLKRHGVIAGKCSTSPANVARAEKMASMYRQGLTLKKIGQQFKVSRERVRQVLASIGITGADGGQSKVSAAKQQAKQNKRDAKSIARWGLGHDAMTTHRASGLVSAYRSQRNAAASRDIEWKLSFPQWLGVWQESGKLDQRGRGKGKYVMSRLKDAGCYEIGNVHIQLATDNSKESVEQWRGKFKANRGVHYLYPGLSKPWKATVCHKQIGSFETEEAAVAARLAYIAANGLTLGANGCVLPSHARQAQLA